MADRYDAICGVKNRQGKTYWTKIGVAFPTRNGGGFSLFLDFIPAGRNEDGKISILLAEPKERDDQPPARRSRPDNEETETRARAKDLDDDEIPFFWAGLVPWIAAAIGASSLVA